MEEGADVNTFRIGAIHFIKKKRVFQFKRGGVTRSVQFYFQLDWG